jgi:hypothetical protein
MESGMFTPADPTFLLIRRKDLNWNRWLGPARDLERCAQGIRLEGHGRRHSDKARSLQRSDGEELAVSLGCWIRPGSDS